MFLKFRKYSRNTSLPKYCSNLVCLIEDNWDDFGFKTIFTVVVYDENKKIHNLGSVKIGYRGQSEGWTSERIQAEFSTLEDGFYSLGQEPEYYEKIYNELSEECREILLIGLKDVVFDEKNLRIAQDDSKHRESEGKASAFNTSLLRSVSSSLISTQYNRILAGGSPLTEYDFTYEKAESDSYSGIKIDFKVNPKLKPSSNIHVLIGRNGVGKTTLLNNMVNALIPDRGKAFETGCFYQSGFIKPTALDDDYFRGVVSVSFSAFDPFEPPPPQPNRINGVCYHYIGLKTVNQPAYNSENRLKTTAELCLELVESLKVCLSITGKQTRWVKAVKKLESDTNFADMNLYKLLKIQASDETENREELVQEALSVFSKLSSGHAIVLLTITKLIETVEEKTLVLIDEPESHLHPPLLSAFIRALSDLLVNRNGVAIIATHSPVVLQETPSSCVSILRRSRLVGCVEKPAIETFGENVGTLTREVFGLEVSKSGFYDLLAKSVHQGQSYEEILLEYQNQIGFEGQAILRALIANMSRGKVCL